MILSALFHLFLESLVLNVFFVCLLKSTCEECGLCECVCTHEQRSSSFAIILETAYTCSECFYNEIVTTVPLLQLSFQFSHFLNCFHCEILFRSLMVLLKAISTVIILLDKFINLLTISFNLSPLIICMYSTGQIN